MSNSEPFAKMAARIDHNTGEGFGGAIVIVPPLQGGSSIELLLLDNNGSAAQFWGTILARAQIELQQIQDKQALLQGFGSR